MSGSSSPDAHDELRRQLETELAAMTTNESRWQDDVAGSRSRAASNERAYPTQYIAPDAPEYVQVRSLWDRFHAWIEREGAAEHLTFNAEPAAVTQVFAIQEEIANGDDTFCFPTDLLASLACHDGQDFASSTGLLGRWYLLSSSQMFTEWRDQKEIQEAGLYTGPKYTQARKAQPRHDRIDTSYWFHPKWIPIACSRGSSIGGDLICIDLAPIFLHHIGQVIMYFTESAERIVLANSLAEWLEACVNHLEQGVYRFDTTRRTYVAGREPDSQHADDENVSGDAPAAAASASSAQAPFPTAASETIGVEAFMFSALNSRDFFIRNQTEALVYLPDNDFGLLSTEGLDEKTLQAALAGISF